MLNYDHEFDNIGSVDPMVLAKQADRLTLFLEAKAAMRPKETSVKQQSEPENRSK